MLIIDSNIWAYYFDSTTQEHSRVMGAVRNAIKREEILMNTVIQMEVAHYLIKRLGPVLGNEKLNVFLGYPFKVDILDKELVSSAIELLAKYTHMGIGGRDATLIASMKKNNATKLMTHDKCLKRIDWVKAIDPCGQGSDSEE